ncbi:hypothetical protein [Ruminococcus sp. JL13D9]|uniref:hypothetical protein n=1 Tax=Ruminococcus sp. JL13D9 TaxID=3233381 RepID=UPI003899B1A8
MTQFQNRRQHWIFPFSVGVTNVQHVVSLSLRFVFEKADKQCAEIKCCSCCPKTQHIHSKETEYQIQADIVEEGDIFTLTFLFYCQFRLCITAALFRAAAKAEAGKAPDCVKSHCPNLARCCPQPLEGEFYEKTA